MFLSKDEEKILDGEEGWVLAKAMKLLVAMGELEGADCLIPIKKSQVAGVSYKTAGSSTLELIESLAKEGVKVKTRATLNPAGMDLERWRDMGVPEDFAEKQLRICSAYKKLGIEASCTCTPYLSGNKPRPGEVVGFSESSAVAFINSVIGAKTNRHGGLDALCAALIGKVPLMGYLLDENRKGNVLVKVMFKPKSETDYAALGYFVGRKIKTNEIPVYEGLRKISIDELKLLGAASAASGSVAMFHVLGVTPEAKNEKKIFEKEKPRSKLVITGKEIQSVYEELSASEEPDLIAIGCPHCSIHEIEKVAKLISGKKVKTKLWVFTSPHVFEKAEKRGCVRKIKSAGGDVFKYTCMVVSPLEDLDFRCVHTNSAKAAFYIPKMTKNKCESKLLSLNECVKLCTSS